MLIKPNIEKFAKIKVVGVGGGGGLLGSEGFDTAGSERLRNILERYVVERDSDLLAAGGNGGADAGADCGAGGDAVSVFCVYE